MFHWGLLQGFLKGSHTSLLKVFVTALLGVWGSGSPRGFLESFSSRSCKGFRVWNLGIGVKRASEAFKVV